MDPGSLHGLQKHKVTLEPCVAVVSGRVIQPIMDNCRATVPVVLRDERLKQSRDRGEVSDKPLPHFDVYRLPKDESCVSVR